MAEGQNAEYAPGLHTCDSCAEGSKRCQNVGDAYVCDDCIAFNEAAADAATDAVLQDWSLFGSLYGKAIPLDRSMVREIVDRAVKVYCEYDHIGSSGDSQ